MGIGVSIVIIDDNDLNLELLTTALQQESVSIFSTQYPNEGLDLIFREHPQIVITDLKMPNVDGLEIPDRVVAFDPSIDVFLTTGHHSSESAVDAIRRGAADYLNNPVLLWFCGNASRDGGTGSTARA